ncbi:MAG TPA: hypothetical protein VF616_32695 [Duganella sp.]|uniref:hypothetical protein n=1 Tax=Duganella sp. TaxID=1904440 RepID=UPI002ED01631
MGKAKIGFEVDEKDLANAKAYVAKHGGSLNKLVSALFASLGQEESHQLPAVDQVTGILLAVSVGGLSIMEASRRLELPDGGHVLHLLAERNLPLPRLPDDFVKKQLSAARSALDDCLVEPEKAVTKRGAARRPATA